MKAFAAVLVVAAILVIGCTSGGRGDLPPALRRPGLRYDQFPDIPFPAGWQTLPGEDHVAIAIGGGSARRLHLAMQAPAVRSDLQPPEAMARYVGQILPETGWIREGDGRSHDLKQTWRKAGETLQVEGERDGGLVVLRYELRLPPLGTGK